MHWIVDGMNVIGSRPDGWWRDRPGARRRLVRQLVPLAHGTGDRVTVVFDGRATEGEEADAGALGVVVQFAPGGPDAADDVIAGMVQELPPGEDTLVVTSDAGLRRRVQAAGVRVAGASAVAGSRRPPRRGPAAGSVG